MASSSPSDPPHPRRGGGGGGFRIRQLLLLNNRKNPDPDHSPLISNPNPNPPPPVVPTTRSSSSSSFFRGLGCSSAADVSSPSAVRSAADWHHPRRSGRRAAKKRRARRQDDLVVADVTDVWCAPGVVFGAEPPVDCVVNHRHARGAHNRQQQQGRRGAGNNEVRLSALLESSSENDSPIFGSAAMRSGRLNYTRGVREPPPVDFDEAMIMFQARFLGSMDFNDQYQDLRLDVDSMSYEELLELSEKIGNVSTGLREEDIFRSLRKIKHSFSGLSPFQRGAKCIICQEEYEGNDDMGRLECGHSYHIYCIKQWLLQKNACPVCKTAITKS